MPMLTAPPSPLFNAFTATFAATKSHFTSETIYATPLNSGIVAS